MKYKQSNKDCIEALNWRRTDIICAIRNTIKLSNRPSLLLMGVRSKLYSSMSSLNKILFSFTGFKT
jgi:hypothetical protein